MDNGFNNQQPNEQQLNGTQGGAGNQQMYQSNPNMGTNGGQMYGGQMNGINYGNNGMGINPNAGKLPNFTTYLVLSILETLCCCWVTGVIGIVFCCLANSSWKAGNTNDAYTKLHTTKIVLIIGLIVGFVVCLCAGAAGCSGMFTGNN